MKHPPTINGIEQMFSVWMVRDETVKPAAKQNKKIFGPQKKKKKKKKQKAKADIYGNDYITSLMSHTDACLPHMAN